VTSEQRTEQFVETLSDVPPTCLEESARGNKCNRRDGHDGPHRSAGPRMAGVEIWHDGGAIAVRDSGESTAQTTLLAADGGRNDRYLDTATEKSEGSK
jgi:hypothetical protein